LNNKTVYEIQLTAYRSTRRRR